VSVAFLGSDLHAQGRLPDDAIIHKAFEVLADRFRPGDWLVILGDLTQDGTAAQYAAARALLAPYVGRCMASLGNHVLGPLGLSVSTAAEARWIALATWLRSPEVLDLGPMRLLEVDSCRRTPRLARGRVGAAELRRLRLRVAAARAAGQIPVAVQHCDPLCDDPTLALDDGAEELAVLGPGAGVWCGHTHRAGLREVGGTWVRTVGALCEGQGWTEIVF